MIMRLGDFLFIPPVLIDHTCLVHRRSLNTSHTVQQRFIHMLGRLQQLMSQLPSVELRKEVETCAAVNQFASTVNNLNRSRITGSTSYVVHAKISYALRRSRSNVTVSVSCCMVFLIHTYCFVVFHVCIFSVASLFGSCNIFILTNTTHLKKFANNMYKRHNPAV